MQHSHHTFTAASASFQLHTSILLHQIVDYLKNAVRSSTLSPFIPPSPGINIQCFISRGRIAPPFLFYAH
jgi:hypothetical protein